MADADLERAVGRVDGVPERFVPRLMTGEPLAAEHLVRYDWAASLAAGRRVLDAGCGVGYGSARLAGGGARTVVGLDNAEEALAAARAEYPDAPVRWEHGDLRELPFPVGCFDLVVCFEVIEHVEESEAVVAELARVLDRQGVLLVSTPHREHNVPGNPHHVRELLPEELREVLQRHLPEVRLAAQASFLASLVYDGELAEGALAEPALLRNTTGPAEALYTVALAGFEPPPEPPPAVALGDPFEVRRWVDLYVGEQAAGKRHWSDAQRLRAALDEQRAETDRLRGLVHQREAELRAVSEDPLWRRLSTLKRAWARDRS